MATYIWINVSSGKVLLPDGTKPFPESILIYYQLGLVAHTLDQFEVLKVSIRKTYLKKTF